MRMLQASAPSGLPIATNRSRAQLTEIAAWLLSVCCTQKWRFSGRSTVTGFPLRVTSTSARTAS